MTTENWIAVMGIAVAATTAIGIPSIGAVLYQMIKIREGHAEIKGEVSGFREHKTECVADRKKLHSEVSDIRVEIAKVT